MGGNDQLVFDGHSVVVDATGEVIAQLSGFTEESRVVDVAAGGEVETLRTSDAEQLYSALVLGLRDYATKCGFSSVCL
ncbi:MAG: NAD+ synthase, partial [bacterium]